MILEITKDERILLLRSLLAQTPLYDPKVASLAEKLMELREPESSNGKTLPLPLEPNGPQRSSVSSVGARNDEQLHGGVSRGRTQGDNQPQRPAQIPLIDRWTSDKFDEDAVQRMTITPMGARMGQTKKKDPMLTVSWQEKNARGYSYAKAFDKALFPWISARLRQETVFYMVQSGEFLNVVGVKA